MPILSDETAGGARKRHDLHGLQTVAVALQLGHSLLKLGQTITIPASSADPGESGCPTDNYDHDDGDSCRKPHDRIDACNHHRTPLHRVRRPSLGVPQRYKSRFDGSALKSWPKPHP